jgi:hypothetical protein
MTDLSPQAQAIVDAFNAGFNRPLAVYLKPRIAAALREVINQLQQSSATHPAFISCPDLLELCEKLEHL